MCRYLLLFIVMASFYIPSAASAVKSSPIRSYSNVVSKSNPYTSQAWLGSLIGGGLSLLGGLFGNKSQSSNIDKQIQAQQEENKKNREYNLMLAQMQNQWNQEQWERENDYNSPEAQMERLKKAGLNPDLMMSQGAHNLAASSPMMTSGAPSQSADMTVLGQKPTLGQAIQTALRDSMIGAQIDNIKANTRKTLADAGISETDAKYRDAEKQLGIKINERVYEKLEHEIDKAFEDARAASYNVEKLNYEQMNARIEQTFKEREMKAYINQLENQAKISEKDAELAVRSFTYRLMGIQSEAELAKYNATLPRELQNKFGDDADSVALLLQCAQYLLGNAQNISTFVGKNQPKEKIYYVNTRK